MSTTPEPMTEARLAAIEQRVQKARPGPWYVDHDPRVDGADQVGDVDELTVCFLTTEDSVGDGDDGAFIAHARQDVAALLAEVRRLRGDPFTCKHDPKYVGGACAFCHVEVLQLLDERSKQVAELQATIKARVDELFEAYKAKDAVAEKLKSAEERAKSYLDRLGRAVGAGVIHLGHSAQLREALQKIRVARTEGGCSTGEAMSKAEAWARDALAISPATAAACQTARSKVVEAARKLILGAREDVATDQHDLDMRALADAVDAYHAAAAQESAP